MSSAEKPAHLRPIWPSKISDMKLSSRYSTGTLAAAVLAASLLAVPTLALPHGYPDSSAARVTRIENGLLPAAVIKGHPAETMRLVDRMKHYNVPGLSIAFFEHGQIAWTRTYGFADVAEHKAIGTDTLFQAASISKTVTALAALRLVQEGKLSLHEDVNLKLRTWKVPENEFTKTEKVTLRRILSHSAGLTVHGFPGYAAGEPLPTILQILNGEKPANNEPIRVHAVPGTVWDYSGGGYIILQLLLSDVTGKPFPEVLHDLVLGPAGMVHSTFEQPLPSDLLSSAALAYDSNGEPVEGGWHTYPEMAPGGLWTTPSDLARFAIEVQQEYAGRSNKILSQSMARQMLTHQKDDWGLGFALEASGHKLRFGHTGSNEGFRADLEAYTEEPSQGVVVMSNAPQGAMLDDEILRAVANEYGWPDFHPQEHTLAAVAPAKLASYTGVYELGGIKHTVRLDGNKLYIEAGPLGREPQQLLPESDTQFFILSDQLAFSFEKDEKGATKKMVIRVNNLALVAKKVQ
ncbi:MAG: serine hydrolase [Candidatus Sulfotelmatobacter sp.]